MFGNVARNLQKIVKTLEACLLNKRNNTRLLVDMEYQLHQVEQSDIFHIYKRPCIILYLHSS